MARPTYALRLLNGDLMANPMKGLPRNMPCGCGSRRKFKTCCLPLLKPFINRAALAETRCMMADAMAGKTAW